MRRAFSLIELLIVVGIISILAAIAVPNYLESQTRAKVSRSKADMRSLATGIEVYRVDFGKYPREGFYATCTILSNGVREITTPIAYLTTYPVDVFHTENGKPAPIQYGVCVSANTYYYLWSFGPDTKDQFGTSIYDPTNGTVSRGDLKYTTHRNQLAVSP